MESWTCETLSIQLLSYRQPALFTAYYTVVWRPPTMNKGLLYNVQIGHSKEMRVYRNDFWSINLL